MIFFSYKIFTYRFLRAYWEISAHTDVPNLFFHSELLICHELKPCYMRSSHIGLFSYNCDAESLCALGLAGTEQSIVCWSLAVIWERCGSKGKYCRWNLYFRNLEKESILLVGISWNWQKTLYQYCFKTPPLLY